MPNQAILLNNIPLLEAKDSSNIENIVTTANRFFSHIFNEEPEDSATKEVLL